MIGPHDVDLALVFERQAERQSDAAHGGQLPVERAEAPGIAGYVVEQERRRAAAARFRKHVGDGTHLDVPVGAIDLAQLPHLVDLFEPAAQPAVLHPLFRRCIGASAGHGVLRSLRCSISIQPSKSAGKVPPT